MGWLAMQKVFEKLNYTQSSVDSEYLFNQLRGIDPKLARISEKEELYTLLDNNHRLREKVLIILSSLGKQNYTNTSIGEIGTAIAVAFYQNHYLYIRCLSSRRLKNYNLEIWCIYFWIIPLRIPLNSVKSCLLQGCMLPESPHTLKQSRLMLL